MTSAAATTSTSTSTTTSTSTSHSTTTGAPHHRDAETRGRLAQYFDADFTWESVRDRERSRIEAVPVQPDALSLRLVGASDAEAVWEPFYQAHGKEFYNPKRYLCGAFPELLELRSSSPHAPPRQRVLCDIGSGSGASLLPVLAELACPVAELAGIAVDASPSALRMLRDQDAAREARVRTIAADVTQVGQAGAPLLPIPSGGVDAVLLVFALSAMPPECHVRVLREVRRILDPRGGRVMFRDHGLYDMVQCRSKVRIGEATYVKPGTGVLCTFFSLERIADLMREAGFSDPVRLKYACVRNVNRKTGQALDRVFVCGVWGVEPSVP